MKSLGIVLMCIFAAVCYGIAHDHVTARVCVEYFTVGHPPVTGPESRVTMLGWQFTSAARDERAR